MHIALHTDKNQSLMMAMIIHAKKTFPKFDFVLREMGDRGYQLQLQGDADEAKPMSFAQGFTAAWNVIDRKIMETEKENNNQLLMEEVKC